MRTIKYRLWTGEEMIHEPLTQMGEKVNEMFNDGNTWLAFTGLKDKNGKEIYEGDVLTKGEGMFKIDGYVSYEDGAFGVTTEHNSEVGFIRLGQKTPFTWEEMEVIGNIYENPDLLSAPSPDKENV